ncbi:MAG: hypothetical protein PHW77_04160 [Eubacteriales bacterium]|nr:hypothetical protein [Eubacteriales bacterium]
MKKNPYIPFDYKYFKIAVILIFVIIVAGISYLLYYDPILSYKIKDFNAYKEDFEVIKDVAERQRQNTDREYFCIGINYIDGKSVMTLYLDDSERIELNDEEQKSLDRIESIFKRFDAIHVYKNKITFDSTNLYSIIYSENGRSPKTQVINGEEVKIITIRISTHWFHAAYRQ